MLMTNAAAELPGGIEVMLDNALVISAGLFFVTMIVFWILSRRGKR